MASDKSVLTDVYYRAFGSIIHSFARVEYGLQLTLSALTGIDPGRIGIVTRERGRAGLSVRIRSRSRNAGLRGKEKSLMHRASRRWTAKICAHGAPTAARQ